ncbi:hypothetical protein GCK32_002669 [Trichostrongylus colubriformis]|uniref:Uncharacterized protein n=1 Tax=Trichostrongylus colubriformis TaxID=6319 RepID=A0AAN8IKK6_TRICO
MKVVVLTVTVALVYSWSCTRSEFEELRFQDIPEEYFKHIILDAETGINGTDCIMSYKVEFKPGKTPLYLFNIERKSAIRRIYGAINGKNARRPDWHDSDNREFMFFLKKCNGTEIPAKAFLKKEKMTRNTETGNLPEAKGTRETILARLQQSKFHHHLQE